MKSKKMFVCSNCGYSSIKWYGKCPNCGEWGTFVEKDSDKKNSHIRTEYSSPVKIAEIEESEEYLKINKQIDDFLGKGLVKGGVYLIAGTPGVGKSTFLLQVSQLLSDNKHKVIYVSAEESLSQISLRAKRLSAKSVYSLNEHNIDSIIASIENENADAIVVDSIHTIFSQELESIAGGVQQVRFCAEKLIETAKKNSMAVIIVAHVTKEGAIAGPKTLEHMVDAVMFLEGDKKTDLRILKLHKNRFGPSDESLILEMEHNGLKIIDDPTVKFLERKDASDGKIYGMVLEGRYPIIVEAQALCVPTPLAIPRRISVGFSLNRLNMLLAVIEKKLNIPVYKYDVYFNIAGGVKVESTLLDMALVSSVISSINKKIISNNVVAVGEFDLSGNIRIFQNSKKSINKIEKLGFKILSPLNGIDTIQKLYKAL